MRMHASIFRIPSLLSYPPISHTKLSRSHISYFSLENMAPCMTMSLLGHKIHHLVPLSPLTSLCIILENITALLCLNFFMCNMKNQTRNFKFSFSINILYFYKDDTQFYIEGENTYSPTKEPKAF